MLTLRQATLDEQLLIEKNLGVTYKSNIIFIIVSNNLKVERILYEY